MPHVTRGLRAALIGAAAALAVGGLTSAAAAQPSIARAGIAGTHPAWATASARTSSRSVISGTVSARVYLAGQDSAGLAAYAMAVSTPGNAWYGRYLTPAQVMARYGPTQAQVSAVTSWLTAAGLTVTRVDDEIGGYVAVQGSVRAAAHAFGVTFGTFRGPDGRADRAPEQMASAPAGVAADVLTVAGLDTATHAMKPADTLPPPGSNYWVAPPCSRYYGQKTAVHEPSAYGARQPWTVCGYTPRQIRGAYGVSRSGMTGKGVKVAVVDAYASPTMLSDANQYARDTGDKPFASGQYTQDLASNFTQTGANECNARSWYAEQTLDVEAVHGMAPGAKVVYVGAANCTDQGLGDALALIVDKHLASVVNASWGEPADQAGEVPVYEEIFQAGAAEGIGFFFASGDSGYENPAEDQGSDMQQADFPPESPFVTSVGGTSLAIGRSDTYEFETGILVGQTTLQPDGTTFAFSLSRSGGTSVSCPLFAGIQADADQAAGHSLGFANPAIYQRFGTSAFHDVTNHPFGLSHLAEVRTNYANPATRAGPLLTYLRTLGVDGEGAAALPAVKGYDDATGVGSPARYIQSF